MMQLSEIAKAVHGQLQGADVLVTGVETDSRRIKPDHLFVALKGERFDGHSFLPTLQTQGVAAALVSQAVDVSLPLVKVEDTRLALGQLASYRRTSLALPVIAVTGSNGKTTTKEMIASILRTHFGHADAVLATEGNFNNDIGMPLTLLKLTSQHKVAVLEMGMNHLGEIDYLTRLAKPNVAVVINAGTAHIGELGSRDNIAQAKGEIFNGLAPGGIAVINADDDYADKWRKCNAQRHVISFGLSAKADVYADNIVIENTTQMHLHYQDKHIAVTLPVLGKHNVYNALSASSTCLALGVSLQTIAQGLRSFTNVSGRLQTKNGLRGSTVIDDTYNANPDSIKAAIDAFSAMNQSLWFVMGDMGELGADADNLHAEIGIYAKQNGVQKLLTLGERSALASRAFGQDAQHFNNIDALIQQLHTSLSSHAVVLVKGSRFMQMERVVEAITDLT